MLAGNVRLLGGGLALLVMEGEALVKGSATLALRLSLTPAVAGMTVVAAGTPMSEPVMSVQDAFTGSSGMAVGNVVGNNPVNIAVALGITSLVAPPLQVSAQTPRIDWPIVIMGTTLGSIFRRSGHASQAEDGLLCAALCVTITFKTKAAEDAPGTPPTSHWFIDVFWVVIVVIALALGATASVDKARQIRSAAGATVIGLTIVAASPRLPQLVTSSSAARRGSLDIAVRNVVDSNLFNILDIPGLATAIHPWGVPLSIDSRDI
jgi:cation:H+ antiporter